MMQAFIIVFHHGETDLLAGVVFGRGIDDIAGEQFLPEGKAAGRTYVGEGREG